ncbi:MAG: cobyric acid synthase [Candidatus Omnitrophica bacterium]|nr:cobyric acid synthase [Candidatus Omnitrophota bacterium]
MKTAKSIQICGTGSGVGKSIITAALCRIFLQDGYQVAPFKSQNMALNSFVTEGGEEIGRAQALQALASRIKPTADINPILVKPTSNTRAQIIVGGKPVRNMSVYEYKDYKKLVFGRVKESFGRLRDKYEIIVIEGAGSPAEINLKSHDLVNMKIARLAGAPVVLVGDIDKGGVFAWLIGTWQLLSKGERKMVKGFIINKFRGDRRLLRSGITFLERYTGIKVLGVIPYLRDLKIPEEDSLPEESRKKSFSYGRKVKISVVYLPHISNFTDFDAFRLEPDVSLKYVKNCEDLDSPDAVIIPGTKNTIEDLNYLKSRGLADKIVSVFQSNPAAVLVGVCGGYQILGEKIYDRKNIESRNREIEGLGILPVVTEICSEKVLSQVSARHLSSGNEVTGYEIHHGRTKAKAGSKPLFEVVRLGNKKARRYDGVMSRDGRSWGTYIHGVFDSDSFRRHFINDLRRKKGWRVLSAIGNYSVDGEIDKLALAVRRNIDLGALYRILGCYPPSLNESRRLGKLRRI